MLPTCTCPTHAGLSRRGFLAAGLAATAAPLVLPAGRAFAADPVASSVTPDEALTRMMEGNERYATGKLDPKDFEIGRAARAVAQHPIAGIVSCADSRVAPEFIFDQGAGDLFIVRVAGNFISDDGLASLEYGVAFLGTPLLLVLGHSGCGAVASAIKVVKDGAVLPGHLPGLIDSVTPAVEAAMKTNPDDLLAASIVENVKLAMATLVSSRPILASAAAAGKIQVVGGVYDIASGRVAMVA